MKESVLIVDNQDSFTYNLKELVLSLNCRAVVVSSLAFNESMLGDFNRVIISPGPLLPKDFPAISKIIEFSERSHLGKDAEIDIGKDAGKDVGTDAEIDAGKSAKSPLSILGICLGHQAIVEYFGGALRKLESPLHGAVSNLELVQPDSIFNGISDGVQVAHYHSWVADSANLPDSLKVLAKSSIVNCRNSQGNMNNKSSLREEGNYQGDGQIVDIIMAVRHKSYNIWGLQFHPESVVSESGREILQNWLNVTR